MQYALDTLTLLRACKTGLLHILYLCIQKRVSELRVVCIGKAEVMSVPYGPRTLPVAEGLHLGGGLSLPCPRNFVQRLRKLNIHVICQLKPLVACSAHVCGPATGVSFILLCLVLQIDFT